jgi:lipopolysaccharide/colanic/teichoic acid biosynthesis glycosyltransferase
VAESGTRASAYLAAGLTLTVAVGPPIVAITRIELLQDRPWLAVIAIVAYQAALWLVAFGRDISRQMRTRWVQRIVDRLDGWALRTLTRYTRRYLSWVAAHNRYLDNKGLGTIGDFTLETNDVLVNLALASKPVHALSSDPLSRKAYLSHLSHGSIWDWLRRVDRDDSILAIIGPPGSGKTTLMRSVAQAAAARPRLSRRGERPIDRIPVLISVRDHVEWLESGEGLSLVALISRSIPELDVSRPPGWIEANLSRGRLVVLFDGLDELPSAHQRSRLVAWIEEEAGTRSGNIVVVSSRPGGYRDNPVAGARVVEVQPFAAGQVKQFIDRWYFAVSVRQYGADNESSRMAAREGSRALWSALASTKGLLELAANPLLLTMTANVHHYRGALPGSRAELYAEICHAFLGKRHEARGVVTAMTSKQRFAAVKPLANHLMECGRTEIRPEEAEPILRPVLNRVGFAGDGHEFLSELEASSGLVIERERGRFAFCHLTFQEFLAACHLSDGTQSERLIGHLADPWWRETIRMYAAITDATSIVTQLVAARQPSQLALAALCADDAAELDAEARQLLHSALRPDDARHDRAPRHLAAAALCELRVESGRSFAPGRTVSEPVTCIEYQLFLDTDGSGRAPVHWQNDIYPQGFDYKPIVGTRYTDAESFSEWLSAQTASEGRLRLPHGPEVELAKLAAEGTSVGDAGIWVDTPPSHVPQMRFWPLLREDVADPSRVPEGGAPSLAERRALAQWTRDEIDSNEWIVSSEADGHQAPSDAAFHAAMHEVEEAFGNLFPGDLEQCVRDLTLASEMLDSSRLDDTYVLLNLRAAVEDARYKLSGHMAQMDEDGWTIASPDERRVIRLLLFQAAFLCATLYMSSGGELVPDVSGTRFTIPSREVLARPTRREPTPSLLPKVIYGVLTYSFATLYSELVGLELRLTGDVRSLGHLVLVRETAASSLTGVADERDGVPTLPPGGWWVRIKPLVDVIAASAALIILSPMLLVIAVLIRLDSDGPAFFRQVRVGRDGELFTMIKFRTMSLNADNLRLSDSELDGVLFKVRMDPRITRLGSFLRRYSIDELPQLICVVGGKMSLVGPRPALPAEVANYDHNALQRLRVKPGVTGLWQVSGRSDLTWAESVKLDNQYVANISLRLDASIAVRTVGAVLTHRGAY